MYKKRKILALIPARGGSKGLKNKNIFLVNDKPLIEYTINAAKNSKYIDDIVVSTDSKKIAVIASNLGADVPFIRPDELARDTTNTIDVVLHAIKVLKEMKREYADLILLQPTQPLRTVEDIDGAIKCYYQNNREGLVSISEVDENPLLIRKLCNNSMESLLNKSSTCCRQNMDKYYKVNGCIYINKISSLNIFTSFNDNKVPYIMDKEHSVDIDEEVDISVMKYYLDKFKL